MMSDEPEIGSPRRPISVWLNEMADDNDEAASESFWPWARARLRGRADAFRVAARMIKSAYNSYVTREEADEYFRTRGSIEDPPESYLKQAEAVLDGYIEKAK